MIDHGTVHNLQTAGQRVLGKLLTEGRNNGLPPLTWTLAHTGALTGEAVAVDPDADGRAAVAAWARHLGATVTETAREPGRVSLYAPFRRGTVVGALRAEIFRLDDDELDEDLDDVADRHADIDAEVFELGNHARGNR